MKKLLLTSFITLMAAVCVQAQGNGSLISLDAVDGLVNGKIELGAGPVTFHFGYLNGDGAHKVKGMTNGYELSATGGVTWTNVDHGDEFSWGPAGNNFDLVWGAYTHSWNGAGADTVGFGGSVMVGQGLPPGYYGPGVYISVEIDDVSAYDGEQFCIDSAYFPPSGTWMWAYGSAVGSFPPDWYGPHCFPIVAGCPCGDINGSGGNVNIADLTYMVAYLFGGGPPPDCTSGGGDSTGTY